MLDREERSVFLRLGHRSSSLNSSDRKPELRHGIRTGTAGLVNMVENHTNRYGAAHVASPLLETFVCHNQALPETHKLALYQ